ncbi:hypothetical protein CRYUN_Cryun04dG0170000 [Craigia yunnanensis]
MFDKDFFTEYGEASQYEIKEVVGRGSYGVVASAIDTHTGEKVAIKKMTNIFEHTSDSTRILREIKLLRLLRHPDIVQIKHIMLHPCRREFKDIFVVFELMESDLHRVVKINDDLTPEHHQFFLYQLLRAHVFHRDLKPKNILANADCKLKLCDFGLARVSFTDVPSAIFWTVSVSFLPYHFSAIHCRCLYHVSYPSHLIIIYFSGIMWQLDGIVLLNCAVHFSPSFLVVMLAVLLEGYTPAVDIWSVGCIFAELLTGKPLFPGKNVVDQLDLVTDLLGTPSAETIARICYLLLIRENLHQRLLGTSLNPLALSLLERLSAFDPNDRPSAEEALADPYFHGLANADKEPSVKPISKFEFERRKLAEDDILEYDPQMLQEYLQGKDQISFMYPREQVCNDDTDHIDQSKKRTVASATPGTLLSPTKLQGSGELEYNQNVSGIQKASGKPAHTACRLLKSDSISASRCVGVIRKPCEVHNEVQKVVA